jgi:hypothetical protein
MENPGMVFKIVVNFFIVNFCSVMAKLSVILQLLPSFYHFISYLPCRCIACDTAGTVDGV